MEQYALAVLVVGFVLIVGIAAGRVALLYARYAIEPEWLAGIVQNIEFDECRTPDDRMRTTRIVQRRMSFGVMASALGTLVLWVLLLLAYLTERGDHGVPLATRSLMVLVLAALTYSVASLTVRAVHCYLLRKQERQSAMPA